MTLTAQIVASRDKGGLMIGLCVRFTCKDETSFLCTNLWMTCARQHLNLCANEEELWILAAD